MIGGDFPLWREEQSCFGERPPAPQRTAAMALHMGKAMSFRALFLCLLLALVLCSAVLAFPRPRSRGDTNTYLGIVPGATEAWESDYLSLLLEQTRGKTIYTFSSNLTSYEEALRVVRTRRPDLVFHLSDEWGGKPEYNRLAEHCPLLLRQHDHRDYPRYHNLHHIPLGFMKGMFSRSSPVSLAPRGRIWSFVGEHGKNLDRRAMVAALGDVRPHFLGSASPADMAAIYSDSEFVPSARGNVVLDCFRLYEASACGAVPVMVGPSEECAPILERMRQPPWLVYTSWEDAKRAMLALRADAHALRARGEAVRAWWLREVKRLQALLAD